MVAWGVHRTTPGGAIRINYHVNSTAWWSGGEHQGTERHKEGPRGHLNKWVWKGTMGKMGGGGNSEKSELSPKGRCQCGRRPLWVQQRRMHYSEGPELTRSAGWLVKRPEAGRSSPPGRRSHCPALPPLPRGTPGSAFPELPEIQLSRRNSLNIINTHTHFVLYPEYLNYF